MQSVFASSGERFTVSPPGVIWGERAMEARVHAWLYAAARPWSLGSSTRIRFIWRAVLYGKLCRIRTVIWQQKYTFYASKALWKRQKSNPPNPGFGPRVNPGFGFEKPAGYPGLRGPGAPGLETLIWKFLRPLKIRQHYFWANRGNSLTCA